MQTINPSDIKAGAPRTGKQPLQGPAANLDVEVKREWDLPAGWGVFKCPESQAHLYEFKESIVEPGKAMYVKIGESGRDPRLGGIVVFARRMADHDAMIKQTEESAKELVKAYESATPTTAGGNAEYIARAMTPDGVPDAVIQ
jgi:hypothetical protein